VYGFNMKHVNAFSMEINLDEEIHDVNSIRNDLTPASQHMESFSKYRRHSDGTHSNYIIASNLGEDEKLSGTIPIAKFEIRYREDSDDTSVNVEKADFVGSNLSTENAFRDEDPEVPSTTKVLTKEDIKSLTFTNDILEEDDGDNGSKLFQQENYFDILFDGDKSGNMAEFKWYMDEDSFGPEVKLPTTFHIDLENEEDVQEINIYNRKSSNGRVTSIEAKAFS